MTKNYIGKQQFLFVCQECGESFLKWSGQCFNCGAWNTLTEILMTKEDKLVYLPASPNKRPSKPLRLEEIKDLKTQKIKTGVEEFDRVLGGGIIPGSILLFAGNPGIGKSTLLLQILKHIKSLSLYVSAEESLEQLKLRAQRLDFKNKNLFFLSEGHLEKIYEHYQRLKPGILIIDSIQAVFTDRLRGFPGSIGQVRQSAAELAKLGKSEDIGVFFIGHVTKEGNIAGPKVLEHLVDGVFYLEGEKFENLRTLRVIKNRFGSQSEVGIFRMKEEGLEEVKNPSDLFLDGEKKGIPGTAITAILEGKRPLLVEIQALSSPTIYGFPRRTAAGIDFNKLQLLLAVLHRRAGINLSNQDVYVKVTGGLKVWEPAVDLAICLAVASSFLEKALDPNLVAFGEVGLLGEIRKVDHFLERIKEAEKLGFKKCLLPKQNLADKLKLKISLIRHKYLKEAIQEFLS